MNTRIPLVFLELVGLSLMAPAVCPAQTAVRRDFTPLSVDITRVESDFSTPWATVETMIRAAKAKDVETLATCFAERTTDAFAPYRDGTATPRQLDALAEWAWEAEVVEVDVSGIRDAQVSVRASPRQAPGAVTVVRTSEGWRIGGR